MKKVLKFLAVLLILSACKENISDKNNRLDDKQLVELEMKTFICINDSILIDVIKKFLLQYKDVERKRVYQLYIRENNSEIRIKLTSTGSYGYIMNDTPSSYFFLENELILVYSGLEVFGRDSTYVKTLKNILKERLPYDLADDGETIDIAKSSTFDPIYWFITYKKDTVIVEEEPEPENSCDVIIEHIEYLPPVKK